MVFPQGGRAVRMDIDALSGRKLVRGAGPSRRAHGVPSLRHCVAGLNEAPAKARMRDWKHRNDTGLTQVWRRAADVVPLRRGRAPFSTVRPSRRATAMSHRAVALSSTMKKRTHGFLCNQELHIDLRVGWILQPKSHILSEAYIIFLT